MVETNKPRPLALALLAMCPIGDAMAAGRRSSSLSMLATVSLPNLLDTIVVAADDRMIYHNLKIHIQYYSVDRQDLQKIEFIL